MANSMEQRAKKHKPFQQFKQFMQFKQFNQKERKIGRRILGGGALLLVAQYWPFGVPGGLAVFLAAYLVVGGDVLRRACRNIGHGRLFDENFLMSLATLGALALRQYPEAVAVMLFYQVGELFQSYAVGRSRRSIADLMALRPDWANVLRAGQLVAVDPEKVAVGDTIVVKPGERIPLDGRVLAGSSLVDTAALTGESLPRSLRVGEEALSGCINLNSTLTIEVTKAFGESTVAKILDLVENATSKKAVAENFITKFARYYTPLVVLGAVMLALLPPLLLQNGSFVQWLERALTFLVISCPCALVISVPLSFFGGIGGAAKCGILVKGSNYLEALAKTEVVVFDKTGTLTYGTFQVTAVEPQGVSAERLLEYAALAEGFSDHPIAQSLKKAYGQPLDLNRVSGGSEQAGLGLAALVDGQQVYVGSSRFLLQQGIECVQPGRIGTVIQVGVAGQYWGYLVIADEMKADAAQGIARLKQEYHVRKTVLLTGDTPAVAEQVGAALGLDEVYAQLLPQDKVSKLEGLLAAKSSKGILVFVGDGINDAPVLARADVGIAMGGLGADAAIEAADIVIMEDQPSKIPAAIGIARRTMGIVKQNIGFALGVKGLVLLLGALGMASMWEAVFADVGVSVIAILNAMRAFNVGEFQTPQSPVSPGA